MINIDIAIEAGAWPAEDELAALAGPTVEAVLAELDLKPANAAELSLLFTDDAHIAVLNRDWRSKDKATNVLSFPAFEIAPGGPLPAMLGDIVLAFETISSEAVLEEKPFEHHFRHLIVHGMLHLLGYDHETDEEAEEMEALERRILAGLAIPDPYG